jgi:hypothetical protein
MYRRAILDVTGCSDDDSYEVEQLMRDANGGVLSHLSKAAIDKEAKVSLEVLRSLRVKVPNWTQGPFFKGRS